MDLNLLTIDSARSAIQERKTTSMSLVESFYSRIQKEDSAIGAYLTLTKERALEQADRIDRMAAEGKPLPPLGGVPVAIKDVMCTRGVRTTAGSKILENFIPPHDSTAVARLEASGSISSRILPAFLASRCDPYWSIASAELKVAFTWSCRPRPG